MTDKLTTEQLDEIEAAALAEIDASGRPGGPLGRIRVEFENYCRATSPKTVLGLIAEVRELRSTVERVRALHQSVESVVVDFRCCRECEECGRAPRIAP